MFEFARSAFLGVVTALAVAVAGSSADASTVVNNGGTYSIGPDDSFAGVVTSTGGGGSWKVRFDAILDPLLSSATATIASGILSNFTDLSMSWVAASDGFLIANTAMTAPTTSLGTRFTVNGILGGNDYSQWLTFSWSGSISGANFNFWVNKPAVVPLPAGGLLLIGALGGLVAFRRRRPI